MKINFLNVERDIFRRREIIKPSKWAPKNTIVQDGLYKGSPPRMDVSPYMAGILNAYSMPGIEEIIVCGSLQIGKTLILYICLGWAMDYRPGTKMLAMPTKETRDRVKKEKLLPFLKGSPYLRKMIDDDYADRISLKNGQNIWLANAESSSQRASITVQDLFLDEEDLYGVVSTSASPVDDFKGRTRSLGSRAKILRVSQPKGDSSSSIWQGLTSQADEIMCYEVKCNCCNQYHLPDVANITAHGEKDKNLIKRSKSARYVCPFCKGHWSDSIRDINVQNGRWMPYKYSPENGFEKTEKISKPRSVGFHVPAILARSVSLSHIYARKIEAESSEDPRVKTQYVNDELAIPYSPVVILTDSQKILELRQNWLPARTVPNGAVALTCGIDVQKRGFWFLVQAYMPDMSSYVIDYGFLADWEDVAKLCFNTYYPVLKAGVVPVVDGHGQINPNDLTGEVMPIWRVAMDSGGTETDGVYSRTEEVYLWVRANGGGLVHTCKGASRSQSVPVRLSILERMPHNGRAVKGGINLYLLDTNVLKTVAMGRMMNPESTQPCKLHVEVDEDFAKQLSSEQQVRENGKLKWVRKSAKNHLLDCLMLSTACADPTFTPSLPMYVTQMKMAEKNANMQNQIRKREKKEKFSRWG